MRRIVGIVLFAVGVLLVVFGSMRLLPGGTIWGGTGVFAAVIGAVIFGLSFIRQAQSEPDAPPPLSPADRITGVFYDPAHVFANLRHHPRWLAAFLVIALCTVIYQVAFTQRVTPEAIAAAPIDKLIESGWIEGNKAALMREQAIEAAKTPSARISNPLNAVGFMFLLLLIEAALFLLCVLMFGGKINYWQALSVANYALLPPLVIQYLLSTVLLYVKPVEDLDPIKDQQGLVRADLGLLFSPTEQTYLYVIASFIGILALYRLWLTATGLRETGARLSNGSAWTIALVLGALYLLFALTLAAIFPNFVT
ncbi:MAG TPA: YIP1 family protein [Pyrinomonadaceae bacterium]|nr:YIP1 family protein [Pyrinomonadaceae bacterium]